MSEATDILRQEVRRGWACLTLVDPGRSGKAPSLEGFVRHSPACNIPVLVLSKDCNKCLRKLARRWWKHFAGAWSTLRNQNVVTCGSRLSVLSAAPAKKQFPKTRPAESKQKPKSRRTVLQKWVLPAKKHLVRKGIARHLDQLVVDAQARRAVVTYVSNCVSIAYTCARRLSDRLCSSVSALLSRLFNSA